MHIVRSLSIVAVSFGASTFIIATDTSVLDGLLVQALSIIAGVAIAAAFFFLQGIDETAERAIQLISSLRTDLNLDPLNAAGREMIRAALRKSGERTYKNAVLILACTLAYVVACIWNRVDLPLMHWPVSAPLSKLQSIHGLGFSTFALSLAATYDIISTAYLATKLGRTIGKSREANATADGEQEVKGVGRE